MQAWRAGLVMCGLAIGCGGALPDEWPSSGTPAEEAVLERSQEDGAGEGRAAEAASEWCAPVGDAQRVKTILPPSENIPRYAEMPESLAEFRGQLYFAVNFEDGRTALWKSGGTEASTTEVKALPALPPWSFARVGGLTPAGDTLFFLATEAATGNELWASDGTSAGTRLVRDLTPGTQGSELRHLTGLGRTLVFARLVPASATQPESTELWRSDGTTAGTERLANLGSGTYVSWQSLRLTGSALFIVTHPSRGTELWRTDGTAAGTGLVRRLDRGQTNVLDVRNEGRRAFFTLSDEGNTEVWQTDGTPGGTLRLYTFGPNPMARILGSLGEHLYLTLSDLEQQWMRLYRLRTGVTSSREYVASLPNPYASQRDALPVLNDVSRTEGKIFFSIAIGSSGPAPRDTQLWVTDGTQRGTKLLRRPLSLSDEYASPLYAVSSGLVFFSAYEPSAGIEPWVSDGTVLGTRRLRDIAPGAESSYPRSFTRSGDRVYFGAYDDTQAGQLWSVPLRSTCLSGER
jgi:ELWxxDGT repeat protein